MRTRVMLAIMLILMSLLAACRPGAEGPAAPAEVVQWNKDPYAVVFRAEIVGGDSAEEFYMLNEVPACTIYGDGRVVWTVETNASREVLFDFLPPEVMDAFIVELGIVRRFYAYKEGFPLQIPTTSKPVYERLTLENNGIKYVSDSYSEWPFDYYNESLQLCIKQAKTPRTFEPDGAWITAQQVEYSQRFPSVFWEPQVSGLSFAEIATTQERRWLEGPLVKILWHAIKDNGFTVQFGEDNQYYRIALQVPGVTRDAPPAPAAEAAS